MIVVVVVIPGSCKAGSVTVLYTVLKDLVLYECNLKVLASQRPVVLTGVFWVWKKTKGLGD